MKKSKMKKMKPVKKGSRMEYGSMDKKPLSRVPKRGDGKEKMK